MDKGLVALYGLGTETERYLTQGHDTNNILGLLDGFRTEGEAFGYPIISLQQAIDQGVTKIIVIARPGSCKVIKKRIGDTCREHGIALFDVRGKDLLETVNATYDFRGATGQTKEELLNKIEKAKVVSFDLFDTLVARKVYSYTDVFALVEARLNEMGIFIPGLPAFRLAAEKELSGNDAPTLEEIYEAVLEKAGCDSISAERLAELEWTIDLATMLPRQEVCEIFRNSLRAGKRVVITTDTYYSKGQIEQILCRFNLSGCAELFVSSEYGTSKTLGLFDHVRSLTDRSILHIGDDVVADVDQAQKRGFDTYRLMSGMELFDLLGGMGLEDYLTSLADRVKAGLCIAELLNDPFRFDTEDRRVSVRDASEIGYLFCAPMITDFILWMKKELNAQGYRQILMCARDGYLVQKLFQRVEPDVRSPYFLTSRTAAIRAGMETLNDIEYVDSMKFFGTAEQALATRFGIEGEVNGPERDKLILLKANLHRDNYLKYIRMIDITAEKIGMFDFVAKGTTQLYLRKLFPQHMKGFYFLQLEPEFMADKNLDIEPFYSDEEKNTSAIFDNYYILETILTAPYPQLVEFDDKGEACYAKENRNDRDIHTFERAQSGIERFFDDYIRIVPEGLRDENKVLDEKFLELVNKVQIRDADFLSIKVEDPFFGRMTDIKDLIG